MRQDIPAHAGIMLLIPPRINSERLLLGISERLPHFQWGEGLSIWGGGL
jgi:hypothetical protein